MVGVSTDLSGIRAKVSVKGFDRGRYALANQMLADMNPFVPFKGGTLRQTGHVSGDNRQLIWQTPYARRHFYAPGGWEYTTPGTGPRWDLKAEGLFMSNWIQAFTKGAGF